MCRIQRDAVHRADLLTLGLVIVAADYRRRADQGQFTAHYRFGEGVLEGPELTMSDAELEIPGYARPVSLAVDNPYGRLPDADR